MAEELQHPPRAGPHVEYAFGIGEGNAFYEILREDSEGKTPVFFIGKG